jgi:hypothetical protein
VFMVLTPLVNDAAARESNLASPAVRPMILGHTAYQAATNVAGQS